MSGLVNVKVGFFLVPQKYEGGGIQRLSVSVPLSVVCACVFALSSDGK